MKKRNNIYIKSLLLLLSVAMSVTSLVAQEGSGNWKRGQTNRKTSLLVPANDGSTASTNFKGYGTRGYMMLPSYTSGYDPGHRFFVYVKQGEIVYFSFRGNQNNRSFNWYYDGTAAGVNNKFPIGTQGDARKIITASGRSSTNNNLLQAETVTGPYPFRTGGYSTSGGNSRGGSFTNTTGADRAFWLEFDSYDLEIDDWDVTVVSGTGSNAVQQTGRVYSRYWSMVNGLPNNANQNFHDNFTFYVPIDNTGTKQEDYFVKSINFGGSNAGFAVFFANETGPRKNGTPAENRKSIQGRSNLYQYPLFVADPDESIWPSSSMPTPLIDVLFIRKEPPATGAIGKLTLDIDYPANVDILVDLNKNGIYDGKDVILSEYFSTTGEQTMTWDGKNSDGVDVPYGHFVQFISSVGFFPVHFPVYDMEQSAGMAFANVRPGSPQPDILYWDHSGITGTTSPSDSWTSISGQSLINTAGMNSPDKDGKKWNRWNATGDNGFGNNRTINTWTGAVNFYSIYDFKFDYEEADLEVNKTVDKEQVFQGEEVTFTVTLKNLGISWATEVIVNDLLPAGLEYVSHDITDDNRTPYNTTYNPTTGIWDIVNGDTNRFMPGHEVKLEIKVRVTGIGNITNTVSVPRPLPNPSNPPALEPDPKQDNNTATATLQSKFDPADLCTTGCNDNTFIHTSDPNSIEYDNIVSSFHATIAKQADGRVLVWGEQIASNGTDHVLRPQELNSTNYSGLEGDILKFTAGSNAEMQNQFAVLTTEGLYVWGKTGNLVSTTVKNTAAFGEVTINGSTAKGLPVGVEPENVKMLFGSYGTLAITTCTGEVWMLSHFGNKNGNGTPNTASNVWHRVKTGSGANAFLENVVAVRGTAQAMIAMTAGGEVYTWGDRSRIAVSSDNNQNGTNRAYATKMNLPQENGADITPKMIGMTLTNHTSGNVTYYILSTSGQVYSLGNNDYRQLGVFNTNIMPNVWQTIRKSSATTDYLTDVAWISPQEHDAAGPRTGAAMSALTADGKLWVWGINAGRMLGAGTNENTTINPTVLNNTTSGLDVEDVVIASELGGHTLIAIKECTTNFGYLGHRVNGSMADGTDGVAMEDKFNFSKTAKLMVCGAITAPVVQEVLKICRGETANLEDAIIEGFGLPTGVTGFTWWTTPDKQAGTQVNDITAVKPGDYYVFYEPMIVPCYSLVKVEYRVAGDEGYELCQNYWIGGSGTTQSDKEHWNITDNWTGNRVPAPSEDIEFATEENNPTIEGVDKSGPAEYDLHLDTDRVIGDLINDSDKDLVITQGNDLLVNGEVIDNNSTDGTIVIQAGNNADNNVEAKATGTLRFADAEKNKNVEATVQFYNQAYECDNCGYFKKQWQYFGIPVSESAFPYLDPKVETINEWMENVDGNKWVNRAVTDKLVAFRGYEITNSSTTKPEHIYSFQGKLNVGDATITLTKTGGVNYSGMNLIANSFTAAIPISREAISFEGEILGQENRGATVYLFNTGTRDQWRKLNGGSILSEGIQGGRYTAVPLELGGQSHLPNSIPSMHTFMVEAKNDDAKIELVYSKLIKNVADKDSQPAWRSSKQERKQEIPHIVLDVIGTQSADRVWLFEQLGTTRGFDNGWDGVKMPETDIVQLYVAGEDGANENYQVATVPQLVGTSFGMKPENNESYTLSMAVSQDVEIRGLYIRDMLTGRSYALKNGAEYRVSASASSNNRFKVVDTMLDESKLGDNPLIDIYVQNHQVVVANNSDEDCTVSLYDVAGKLVAKQSLARSSTTYINGRVGGAYVVKVVGTQSINESKRVIVGRGQ